jgi:hypothetical protein
MSEEVLAEVPAPEQEATAVPESVEAQPVKAFTQEELDAAIGKRLAREQRKWERERAVAAPVVAADPRPEQFDSTESYADALALKKAEQLLYDRDVQRQQTEILGAYHDREEDARSKYDDFEQVAYNPSLKITTVMAQTIQSSDIGPDVAYYLGVNPKEADRISRLAPYVQAKEIGRIEAKLASEPMVKKTSSAPPPVQPVTPSSKGTSSYDTTDPRSIKTMSTSEWIAADRARQVKKMEARLR